MIIKVIFGRSKLPGSAIIRAFTWSDWSHVGLIDESTNEVIEAKFGGVQTTKIKDFVKSYPDHVICNFWIVYRDLAIEAAREQIGKPFDYAGLIGVGLHRDWQEDDSWFCSELVAYALFRGGRLLYRNDVMKRITPQHLWMLTDSLCVDNTYISTIENKI